MALNKNDNWFISNTNNNQIIRNISGSVSAVSLSTIFEEDLRISTVSEDVSSGTSTTATGGKYYRITSLSNDLTFNLPSVSNSLDYEIGIKIQMADMGGKTVTLTPNGSDTIDGQNDYVMNIPYLFIRLKSDGVSEWMIS